MRISTSRKLKKLLQEQKAQKQTDKNKISSFQQEPGLAYKLDPGTGDFLATSELETGKESQYADPLVVPTFTAIFVNDSNQCVNHTVEGAYLCSQTDGSNYSLGFNVTPDAFLPGGIISCLNDEDWVSSANDGNNYDNFVHWILTQTTALSALTIDDTVNGVNQYPNGPCNGGPNCFGVNFFTDQCPGCVLPADLDNDGNIDVSGNNIGFDGAMISDGSCQVDWCYSEIADNYFCFDYPDYCQENSYDIFYINSVEASNNSANSCQIGGCLDQNALNFCSFCTYQIEGDCTIYDGDYSVVTTECCYIMGCTDPVADNYNPIATADDDSCEYSYGCTDIGEFDQTWWEDPDSTNTGQSYQDITGIETYPGFAANNAPVLTPSYDDGSCDYDLDNDGVLDGDETEGCTDSNAANFNVNATDDDGSCYYVPGCTEPFELDENGDPTDVPNFNYDETADYDDGSCYPAIGGCLNPDAFNYIEPTGNVFVDANTDDGSCIPVVLGCTDATMFNYDNAANTDDGTCEEYIYGCTDEDAFNFEPNANTDDGSCVEIVTGCTDSGACNYNPLANTDDNSCVEPGDFNNYIIGNNVCGCTIYGFDNFSAAYTINDGSCEYTGCLDNTLVDDGQGGEVFQYANAVCDDILAQTAAPYANNVTMCVTSGGGFLDINNDAGTFIDAGNCNEAEIIGCTDPIANNYNSEANTAIDVDGDGYNDECEYNLGCQDINAGNYVSTATGPNQQDACEFAVCTDPTANNYVCLTLGYLCSGGNLGISGTDNCTSMGCFEDNGECEYTLTGCGHPSATNYPGANFVNTEDGSCTFEGCQDPGACNTSPYYDFYTSPINGNNYSTAGQFTDDGSCEYTTCQGCMNSLACNYDPAATIPDLSCEFPQIGLDCDGNQLEYGCYSFKAKQCAPDLEEILVNSGFEEWLGQTLNPPGGSIVEFECKKIGSAHPNLPEDLHVGGVNPYYDPSLPDNYEFEFPGYGYNFEGVMGCTDQGSCNYNSNAWMDDGSCEYESCLDCCGVINGNNDTCDGQCGPCNDETSCIGCLDDNAENYCDSCTIDCEGCCEYYEHKCIWCPGYYREFDVDGNYLGPDHFVAGYWYIQSPSQQGDQGWMSPSIGTTPAYGAYDDGEFLPNGAPVGSIIPSGVGSFYWTGDQGLNKDPMPEWFPGQGASLRCQLVPVHPSGPPSSFQAGQWGGGNGPLVASGAGSYLLEMTAMQGYCAGLGHTGQGSPISSNTNPPQGGLDGATAVNGCSVCPVGTALPNELMNGTNDLFDSDHGNAGHVTCKLAEGGGNWTGPDYCASTGEGNEFPNAPAPCMPGCMEIPNYDPNSGWSSADPWPDYGAGGWGCQVGNNTVNIAADVVNWVGGLFNDGEDVVDWSGDCRTPIAGGYPCPIEEQPDCCRFYSKNIWQVSGNTFTATNTLTHPDHENMISAGHPDAEYYINQCT